LARLRTTLKSTPGVLQPQCRKKEPTITAPAAYPLDHEVRIRFHDHVRVPDGRVGKVIGFYRRDVEAVLVKFPSGETGEFLTSEMAIRV
jgi:hypothetical protein